MPALLGIILGATPVAVQAQSAPAPASLIADCGKFPLDQAEWAIQQAANCSLAQDIYEACAGPRHYHLHSDLVHAFQERCERDLEGRLSPTEQRRLEREQARCSRGAADGNGVIGNFGSRILRECQARIAAKFAAALEKGKRP